MSWSDLRYRLRSVVGVYPVLFFPLQSAFGQRYDRCVTRTTDIVIEGFPRSANSYATVALQFAQLRPLNIAHHLHAPAQVRRAVCYGLPCLVLIRHPVDALKSFRVARPDISVGTAARDYVRFYSSIARLKANYVIGEFDEVTQNFDRIIQRLNQHFNKDFRMLSSSEIERNEISRALDRANAQWSRGNPAIVARPTRWKEQKKELLSIDPTEPPIADCVKIYEDFRSWT